MHIVMISAEYPPRWGGMGSTVYHLSRHLAHNGHKVSVITRSNKKKANVGQNGIDVYEVPWVKIPMYFTRSFAHHSLKALNSIAIKQPIDVIHLHLPMVSLSKNQMKKCRSIAPTVASLHGSWLGERDGLITARNVGEPAVFRNPNDLAILLSAVHYAKYEKTSALNAHVSISNSKATQADFIERYKMPPEWNCKTIYWGVDTDLFCPVEENGTSKRPIEQVRTNYGFNYDDPVLLAVGRLAARKGYSTLLRAFRIVIKEIPNAKLLIVGRGGMKKNLYKYATKEGFKPSIRIESSLDFNELSNVYNSCDLTIFPSYYEGQGLIPLESMSSGVPVIATNSGPIPEMVDDEVGSLFELGDDADLAKKIIDELSQRNRLLEKGKKGRQRVVDRFSFKDSCKAFEGIYEDLASGVNDLS